MKRGASRSASNGGQTDPPPSGDALGAASDGAPRVAQRAGVPRVAQSAPVQPSYTPLGDHIPMLTRRRFMSTLAAGLGAGVAIPALPLPSQIRDQIMARRWRVATSLREIVEVVLRDAVRALEHGPDHSSPSWIYPAARRVDWALPDRRQVLVYTEHDAVGVRRTVAFSVLADVIWTHVRSSTPIALYDPWPWHLTLALLSKHPLMPDKVLAGQLGDDEWRLFCRRARELADAEATVIRSCRWRPLPSPAIDVVHVGRRPTFYRDVVRSGRRFVVMLDTKPATQIPHSVGSYRAIGGVPIQVVPAGQLDLPGLR